MLLLCLLFVLQCFAWPVYADETTASDGEETEETTEEPVNPQQTFEVQQLSADDISVVNGCRTLEGMYPLGGSDRMLETAQAAFVYEINTQTVIYSYNPDLRVYPGVLTKMVTALVTLDYCSMDEEVTVKSYEFKSLPLGALHADLREGEKLTIGDLLHLMILESANDAALALAAYVAGGQTPFVELMNQKLQEIGCVNTHFADCHGLSTTDQYTTARDMAKIVAVCTENPDFCEVFSATSYKIAQTNKSEARSLKSMNYLTEQTIVPKFNYAGVTGGMPSYSNSIGASIACTAEKGNMDLIYIVMGATRTYSDRGVATYYGNFEEVIDLLEFTFSNFRIYRMIYQGQALKQFQVGNGEQDVVGMPAISIDTVLLTGTKQNNLIEKYTLRNGGLTAPIAEGEEIATVQIWYGASCLAELDLYAMSEIRAKDNTGLKISDPSRDDSNIGDFLGFLGVLCLVIAVLVGGYLAYNSFRRSMIRARRRRRRASRRRSR